MILQSQFLIIWWAPVCHLPVHSVCPKLWLPPQRVFYNDILASDGTHSYSTASMQPSWRNSLLMPYSLMHAHLPYIIPIMVLPLLASTASQCKLHHANFVHVLNVLTKCVLFICVFLSFSCSFCHYEEILMEH